MVIEVLSFVINVIEILGCSRWAIYWRILIQIFEILKRALVHFPLAFDPNALIILQLQQ